MNWTLPWLFLHVTAAVIAFGPTFAFPFIGAQVRATPQHIPFAIRFQKTVSQRLILPVALTMAVSGVGLIVSGGLNPFSTPWLLTGIVLYVFAIGISVGVLLPAAAGLERMVSAMPAAAGPGAAPAGPPPAFLALIKRAQTFGMVNQGLFLVIIFLMTVKPGAAS